MDDAYQDRYSDLLALLHAGILETPMLQGFLKRLRELTQAEHCAAFFRRTDAPLSATTLLTAGDASPALRAAYETVFHRLDPIPYERLRPGRVYARSEFMLENDERHAAFMQQYAIPNGLAYQRVMRVAGGENYNAWITIWSGKQDLRAAAGALLSTLAPHISMALRTHETVERIRMRARIAEEAVRRLNFGWLTLDVRGHVLDIDPEAEKMLGSIQVSQRQVARWLEAVGGGSQRLPETLREFSRNPDAPPLAIRLNEDPTLEMLLMPMPDKSLSGARPAVAIAYMHGDNETRGQRVEHLMDMFRLTRSEARLALNLARGRTIAESAEALGLTVETARNYSKHLYSKMGVRSQAGVVRTVSASVAALV